jgi:hypothetical protein
MHYMPGEKKLKRVDQGLHPFAENYLLVAERTFPDYGMVWT